VTKPKSNKGETLHMSGLDGLQLESNSKIKINFDGGDLSSDSGLLLSKEFAHKFGFHNHVSNFKTDDKISRRHKDDQNLYQMVYQIIAGYFEDDDADEHAKDVNRHHKPLLTILG
jgi:hypothetical protein